MTRFSVPSVLAGTVSVFSCAVFAQTGPDVFTGDVLSPTYWGRVGEVSAYSIGATACNGGTAPVLWSGSTNQHPIVAQNVYRLRAGQFEQIGQSWVAHESSALQTQVCFNDCQPTDLSRLGVHCSSPSTSSYYGSQANLSPRWQVNAYTGQYTYPPLPSPPYSSAIDRRVQIHDADLSSAQNPNALYYLETQFVTADDARAGNGANNASFRPARVNGGATGPFSFALTGATRRQSPAIFAWREADPAVHLASGSATGDGVFWIASRATSNGNGTWNYEYAVQNINSHRSGGSFTVPLTMNAAVSGIGFHDVNYHSGEPFDSTDWNSHRKPQVLFWRSPQTFTENPNSNALRWGTLYNFRFVVDRPPVLRAVELGLFRPADVPGQPDAITLAAYVPQLIEGDLNGDCTVDQADLGVLLAALGHSPAGDLDGDGDTDQADLGVLLAAFGASCPG